MDPSDVDIATLKSFKLHTQKSLLTYSPTNINSTLVIICVDENNQPIKIHQTNNNLEDQNTIFEQDLNQLFSSSSNDNPISFSPEAFHYLKDHKLTGGSKEFELKLILGIILYLTKKRVLVDSDKNFENLPKMIEILLSSSANKNNVDSVNDISSQLTLHDQLFGTSSISRSSRPVTAETEGFGGRNTSVNHNSNNGNGNNSQLLPKNKRIYIEKLLKSFQTAANSSMVNNFFGDEYFGRFSNFCGNIYEDYLAKDNIKNGYRKEAMLHLYLTVSE